MSRKAKDWLTETHDYERPHRGEIRPGVLLELSERGAVVDVGLKYDGFVPRKDIEKLEEEVVSDLEPGQEVVTQVVRPEDRDSNLILSLSQAQKEKDWQAAQALFEGDEIWQGEVSGYNQSGLLIEFGQIRAFVPLSHFWQHNQQIRRQVRLDRYIGQELPLKFIEINRPANRLVASERRAREQMRQQNMEKLLGELVEGEVRQGVVCNLTNYGAFIDLGGANGLIHKSELSWRRIRHPNEVLQVGNQIEVYILNLDHEYKRISLSLKRLSPDPWTLVDTTYYVDQLVSGTVINIVYFGAFVALKSGLEGLVHISELADPPPQKPQEVVQPGNELVFRILRIDSFHQRMNLSLKKAGDQVRDDWLAQHTPNQSVQV